MLKFDTMVHVASSGTPGQRNFESPLRSNSRWQTAPKVSIFNSAADCSISLKSGTEFDHMTANTLQTFKVIASMIKVTV